MERYVICIISSRIPEIFVRWDDLDFEKGIALLGPHVEIILEKLGPFDPPVICLIDLKNFSLYNDWDSARAKRWAFVMQRTLPESVERGYIINASVNSS